MLRYRLAGKNLKNYKQVCNGKVDVEPVNCDLGKILLAVRYISIQTNLISTCNYLTQVIKLCLIHHSLLAHLTTYYDTDVAMYSTWVFPAGSGVPAGPPTPLHTLTTPLTTLSYLLLYLGVDQNTKIIINFGIKTEMGFIYYKDCFVSPLLVLIKCWMGKVVLEWM